MTELSAANAVQSDPEPAVGSRLDSLDLLRGVAVLGILLVNLGSMAMPLYGRYLNVYTPEWVPGHGFPAGHVPEHGVNYAAYVFVHVFADMKFITMFSMLFGAGILLQGERLAVRGMSPWKIHYGRMAVLLCIGLAHAYLLWRGDILTAYAVCGILFYPLRRLPSPILLFLGVLLLSATTLELITSRYHWHVLPQKLFQWDSQIRALHGGGNDVELAAYRGGWLHQMPQQFWWALWGQTTGFLTWTFLRSGGSIFIGMALQRLRFFHGTWPRAAYMAIAILATPVGWIATYLSVAHNGSGSVFQTYGGTIHYWASLITELGYISLGVLVALWAANPARRMLRACLVPIRAVGRTALSNYILQSVLGTTLFYGHGFGLFGYLWRAQLLGIVVAIWAFELVVSPIWLHFFGQGPLEWLWHRIVYWRGEPPPLRVAAPALAGTEATRGRLGAEVAAIP